MLCPVCANVPLSKRMTKLGVEVDYCGRCKGVWLDQGEIFYFTRDRRQLEKALEQALANAANGDKRSPKSGKTMRVFKLFPGTNAQLILDTCAESGGIWFDGQELERLMHLKDAPIKITPAARSAETTIPGTTPPHGTSGSATLLSLPNLFLRSFWTIGGLYAAMTLLLITAVEFADLHADVAVAIGVGVAILQFLISPWIMDLTLRFLYRIEWVTPDELPPHLRDFVARLCRDLGMRHPEFGIIDDGAPNAFTYGHHPGNARIVITRGILDLLEPNEVEAVVAHEIGHAKHWDMLLMTIIQIVPLVLYYLYRTLIRMGRGSRKGRGQSAALAIVAYLLYIISEYMVLWFSRTREYYADRFAGAKTGDPNFLASALVKIAYGLAGQQKPKAAGSQTAQDDHTPMLDAVGALGIFDVKAAHAVAVTGYAASGMEGGGGTPDKRVVADAMKWDLWNPWAKYYELHSTHPLVANRLRYLGNQSVSMGKQPFIRFDERRPESYWDDFFFEVLVMWLPFLLPLLVLPMLLLRLNDSRGPAWIGAMLTAAAVGGLVKLRFSYRSDLFPNMNVASLLKQVKVSAVRPVPCTLKGTIIGRGVPGLIWSEDFVVRDDSGIIFLDYRQPLRLWEFFFGLLRAKNLQNHPATIIGWYRRAPMPYIEIKALITDGDRRNCYVYAMKLVSWIALLAFGMALTVASLSGLH